MSSTEVPGFERFARGDIYSNYIDSVPLIKIARATSSVETELALLLERRPGWDEELWERYLVPLDASVALPKMMGAYYVFASCTLDVGGGAFRELQAAETGLSQPSPELADFRKMVQDHPPMLSSL